jgi:hypothetical protein
LPHVVRRRWLHRESILEPLGALSRDDAEEWLPRLRLAMREMLLQHADPSQRLHLDVRRRPMCAGFLVPDHRPSHLRKLNAVWRGHRRRCEPEGLEHFRNEVDQNCLKLDSGGRNPFDPTNLIVGWSPNAQEHRIETTDPNAGLNPFDPKTNRLKIATNSSPNRCCRSSSPACARCAAPPRHRAAPPWCAHPAGQ